jgi:hypothetical protein
LTITTPPDTFEAMLSGIGDAARALARIRGRDAALVVAVLVALALVLVLSSPDLGRWALTVEPGPARP